MQSIPKILTGIFAFSGAGLDQPSLLDESLVYIVPPDRRAQAIYLRAGNSSEELICLTLARDGRVMRLFPVGAKASLHVPLAVLEDIEPDCRIEVLVGAPSGIAGTVVLDLGLMEI